MRIVEANGVALCVHEFGAPADPGMLLVGGAASSMDWWEDEFCERLAAGGRRVVRYDLRDTGRSVTSPAGRPDYTGQDLVDDAAALIDVLGLRPAHVVGLSMGGALAQILALGRPELVATLTLMSTTPAGHTGDDLPPPTLDTAPPPDPDWTDRAAAVDHVLAVLDAYAGGHRVDESRMRPLVARIHDRTTDVAASQTNHYLLDSADVPGSLGDLAVPTLVVHGTADPLLPVEHGRALVRAVPGATWLPLPGAGHEYPPPATWDTVIDALLRHTAVSPPGTRAATPA